MKNLLLCFSLVFCVNVICKGQYVITETSGSNPSCSGNSITLTATYNGSYWGPTTWTKNGIAFGGQQGSITDSPTVGAHYVANGGSSRIATYDQSVRPYANKPVISSGPTLLCTNSPNTVYYVTGNGDYFIWSITPSNAGNLIGNNSNNNYVTVDWDNTYTGSASLAVTGYGFLYYCTGPTSNAYNITINSTTGITAVPSLSVIQNSCINLAGDNSATTYLWSTNETVNSIYSCFSSNYTLTTTYSGGLTCQNSASTFVSNFANTQATPNGKVYSMYENSGKLYFGGDFNYVGPVSGYSASIDNNTALFDANLPRINGNVNCVISDGIGGWFVGGLFTKVGIYNYKNLVHIKADKSIDASFKPEPNGEVKSLVLAGSKIYAAGNFTTIGEVSRGYLAQIDISIGMATSWDPQINNAVSSIVLYDNDIIAGGSFTSAGGLSRNYLAAIDTVYGQSTTWNPNPDQAINKLVLLGVKLYVAGNYTTIAGSSRNKLACIMLSTEAVTSWNPNPNNTVYDILPTASAIYVCGDFTSIGGQSRNYLASVNITAGTALTWNPAPNNSVYSLCLDGTDVIAGGKFTLTGTDTRNCIAKISSTTGLATTWNPDIHGVKGDVPMVKTLAMYGSNIYAGGVFYSMGGQTRNNAACINVTSGQLDAWNPNVNNIVHAIYADNSYVYIGGEFTLVNGSIIKNRIAQLNTSNAVATGWNPNSDGIVHTLVAKGAYLYAGGEFANIGNNPRPKLAAIKLSDGTSSTWNPSPNAIVRALAFWGDYLEIGGDFTTIGGQGRNRLAAYNVVSDWWSTWNPNADNSVYAISTKGNRLFIGGSFANIYGQSRKNFAIFNATNGVIESANPSYFNNTVVNAVATSDSVVYMGGAYSFYNNNSLYTNKNASALENNNQLLSTYWHPEPNNALRSICVINDKVFLGGDFTEVLSVYQPFLVGVDNYCVANAHIADPFTHQFCEGDGVYLNADTNSHYSYQWYLNNALLPGADSSSYAPVLTGSYTVKVTDNQNYGYLFSNNVSVEVDQLADSVITPSGAITFCSGSVNLLAATGTGYTYQWYKNGSPISGQITNTYSATTSGNYYAEILNASGCSRNSQHIIVNASGLIPVISALGDTIVCQGNNVVLSSDHTTGNEWFKDGITTGINTQNYTASIAGVYKCFVTAGSCSGFSRGITVTVNATPSLPTATTTYTYCQGATATQLSATGSNLLWYTVPTNGTGSSTAPTPLTTNAGTTHYYVSQTISNCEGQRTDIAVTVNATPSLPTATTTYTYCQNATATQLTATGSNLLWYTVPTNGTGSSTAPTPLTTSAGTTHYYVSQTISSCEGPRTDIAVTVNATPSLPTATTTYTYCQNATATQLTATGSNLLWYTVPANGTGSSTAPTPLTITAGTTHYYVSQTISSCEGPRTDIAITVNATPSLPTATTTYTYCQGATATQLSATGSNLLWYTVPTNGTGSSTAPTPLTTSAGTTHYYVSQTVSSCEGPRNDIVVTVNATPALPTATTTYTYCQGATATQLSASGSNLLWYTVPTNGTGSSTAPTPVTTSTGTTHYYVSQTISSCEGPRTDIAITVNATPSLPTATTTYTYCQGATATQLSATGSNLLWYTVPTNGTGSSTAPMPLTTNAGTTHYYVSQTTGSCESPRTDITVTIYATPQTPFITINSLVLHSDAATGNQWYNQSGVVGGATTQDYTPLTEGDYYVIVTVNGCPSAPSNSINVLFTGIEQKTSNGGIKVYPNPVSDELIIEAVGNNETIYFEIYNSVGQLVLKGSLLNKTIVQTASFATGVYLIKLANGKEFEFKKIVKE